MCVCACSSYIVAVVCTVCRRVQCIIVHTIRYRGTLIVTYCVYVCVCVSVCVWACGCGRVCLGECANVCVMC